MRHDSPSGRFVTRCSGGRAARSTTRPKEPVLSTRPRHLAPGTASGGPRLRPARHGLRGPGRARAFLLISFLCGFLLVAAPLALLFSGSGVPGSGLFGGSGGPDGADGSGGSGGAATLTPAPRPGGVAPGAPSSGGPRGGARPGGGGGGRRGGGAGRRPGGGGGGGG